MLALFILCSLNSLDLPVFFLGTKCDHNWFWVIAWFVNIYLLFAVADLLLLSGLLFSASLS